MPPATQSPIRVLLIGAGFGAKVHAPGFASDRGYKLVGIASERLESAKAAAAAHRIPYATDDWKKMLEEVDADLVSVATPVDLHYPMARAALERKRHVLLEKPFALNVAQAKELTALARTQGVVNAINHEFRHYPARAALTRLIQEGRLGNLEHIAIRDRLPGWARDPSRRLTWLTDRQRGGGYLGALGSHHMDTLMLWAGPIRRLFCTLRSLAPRAAAESPAHQAITADDCFTLLVEFESGATGIVDLFGGGRVRSERFEVFGSEDALTILDPWQLGRQNAKGGVDAVPIPPDLDLSPTPDAPALAPFRVMIARLKAAIRGEGTVEPTFADAIRIQEALDVARKSDQSGRWVTLGE